MEQLEYIKIPLRGKYGVRKFTLVDGDYDGEYFSQYRWYLHKNGYVTRKGYSDGKRTIIYLHREICKPPDNLWVDHIDRDKLNNRSCNLRWVTPQENAQNRIIKSVGKTYGQMTKTERRAYKEKRRQRILAKIKTPEYKAYKANYDRRRYLKSKRST
jgi:hypothetical protein